MFAISRKLKGQVACLFDPVKNQYYSSIFFKWFLEYLYVCCHVENFLFVQNKIVHSIDNAIHKIYNNYIEQIRVCLKIHSYKMYASIHGIFCPNSVAVASYDALIRSKSSANCDAHLAESIFQTHSRKRVDYLWQMYQLEWMII